MLCAAILCNAMRAMLCAAILCNAMRAMRYVAKRCGAWQTMQHGEVYVILLHFAAHVILLHCSAHVILLHCSAHVILLHCSAHVILLLYPYISFHIHFTYPFAGSSVFMCVGSLYACWFTRCCAIHCYAVRFRAMLSDSL